MKRGLIILVIGVVLLLPALAIVSYLATFVEANFPTTGIAMQGVSIEPTQSESVVVSLFSEKELYLMVVVFPRDVPMIVQVIEPNGNKILESAFNAEYVSPLPGIREGDFQITVINIGDQPVVVNSVVSADPLIQNLDFVSNLVIMIFVGMSLLFLGIILIIVGGIILIYDRRRVKIR